MTEALEKIRQETLARLQAARDGAELDEINVSILGRNGALTGILRGMGQLSKDERAKLGQAANTVKKELEAELAKRKAVIGEKMQALRFEKEALDVTEPGKPGQAASHDPNLSGDPGRIGGNGVHHLRGTRGGV